MIEGILPPAVHAAEEFHDPAGVVLFPEEAACLTRAVDKRRREFTTVRHCARLALARLGLPPVPIVPGPRGAPGWPDGLVGSMTHCDGYRAAALARARDVVGLGIDAEPHQPLPDGVLALVADPPEQAHLAELAGHRPDRHWDRLLFCAKEALYKLWFPLTGRWLGFPDARLRFDPDVDGFTARVLVPGVVHEDREWSTFAGRLLVRDGLAVTAITWLRDTAPG